MTTNYGSGDEATLGACTGHPNDPRTPDVPLPDEEWVMLAIGLAIEAGDNPDCFEAYQAEAERMIRMVRQFT